MSIQTSDADLKAAQEQPLSGLTLSAITNTAADDYLFKDIIITNSLGSSAHPIQTVGNPQVNAPIRDAIISYLSGAPSSLEISANGNPPDYSTQSCSVYLAGSVPSAEMTTASGYYGSCTVEFTADQTSPLAVSINSSGYESTQTQTITANNLSEFVLESFSASVAFAENNLSLNLDAATSVSLCDWSSSGFEDSSAFFNLTCNATTLILPSLLANADGGESGILDTFIAPLDAAAVNAILALYVASNAIYTSLTIGGTSASPTGSGITDKATLIANGNTVSTN